MPLPVVTGAQIQCSFGVSPAVFTASPATRTLVGGLPVGTINDFIPFVNIGSFGMCTSQTNPAVAAATVAALGVPTPAPCAPVTLKPWTPAAPATVVGGAPVLASGCTNTCAWGGVLQVVSPGQVTVTAG